MRSLRAPAILTITHLRNGVEQVLLPGQVSNDPTPRISGSVAVLPDRRQQVLLYSGSTLLGPARLNRRSGRWSISPLLPPASGTSHALRARLSGPGQPFSASRPFQLDTVAPTLTITADDAGNASGAVLFTFQFSEPVSGFSADAVAVSGGSKGLLSGAGRVYTLPVTPAPNALGTLSVAAAAGLAHDDAGNGNAAAAASRPFDTRVPDAPVFDALPARTGQAIVTVRLSAEPGCSVQLRADGRLLGSATETEPGRYVFLTSPLADGVHAFTATATNTLGRQSAPASAAPLTVDTTAPAAPQITSPALTGDLTPRISGMAEAGCTITLTLAGASYTTSAIGGVWSVDTGTITPQSGTLALQPDGSHPLLVIATDAAGNSSSAASQVLVTDSTAPTLTISADDAGNASGAVLFTFQFSEPVSGFSADAVAVSGGSRGAFTTLGPDRYSLQVLPEPGPAGVLTVTVPAGAAADGAGNGIPTAVQAAQAFSATFSIGELAPLISLGAAIPLHRLQARWLHSDAGIIPVAFAPDLPADLQAWWLEVLAFTDTIIEPEFAIVSADDSRRQVTIGQVSELPDQSGNYSYRYFFDGDGMESRADPEAYTITLDDDAYSFSIHFGDSAEAGWKTVAFHELGHALGLEHSFDDDDGDSAPDLDTNATVMSYTAVMDADGHPGFTALDRAALIRLHGAESGLLAVAPIGAVRVLDRGPFDLEQTWRSPLLTMRFEDGPTFSEPGAGRQRSTRLLLTRSEGTIDNAARVNLHWTFADDLLWNFTDVSHASAYDVLFTRTDSSPSISQVTFAPGQASASITLTVNGDTRSEDLEWLEVSASPARIPDHFRQLPTAPARLTIADAVSQASAVMAPALQIAPPDPLIGRPGTPAAAPWNRGSVAAEPWDAGVAAALVATGPLGPAAEPGWPAGPTPLGSGADPTMVSFPAL